MKRIFVLLILALLIAMLPTVVFAEDNIVETEPPVTDTATPDTEVGEATTLTGKFLAWVWKHIEKIILGVFLGLLEFFSKRQQKKLADTASKINNNAVTVAENSNESMLKSLVEITGVSNVAKSLLEKGEVLLSEFRKTAEEKLALEATLAETKNYLKTAKLANVEFANELAELLVLANIPNAKKEELYSRHRAAVDAIAVAETEVTTNDVQEA